MGKSVIIIIDALRQEEINSIFFVSVAGDERSNHCLFGETHATDTIDRLHLIWIDLDLVLLILSTTSHAAHTGSSSLTAHAAGCSRRVMSLTSCRYYLQELLRIL